MHSTCVFLAAVFLVTGTVGAAGGPIIEQFESLKLMHSTDEPVRLRARLKDAALAKTVQLWVQSGIDEPRCVLAHQLADVLKNGVLNLSWSPAGRQYGHAFTLRLLDEKERLLAEAGPVVVEVCDQWGKMVRMTTIHSWRHLGPDFPRTQIVGFLQRQKKDFVNVVEIFEFKCVCGGLTPPQLRRHDCAHYPSNAGKARQSCLISSATVKNWVRQAKAHGIRMIGYCNMMTAPEPVFRRTGRIYKRAADGRLAPKENPWWKGMGWYIPDSSGLGEVFGAELASSIAEYGWDGWFLDSVGGLFSENATSFDADGKPLSSIWKPGDWQGDSYHLAWDEKAEEFLGELRSELSKRRVQPVLVCNAMSEALWRGVGGPYWKRLDDPYRPFRNRNAPRDDREIFLAARASRHSPVWFAEYSPALIRSKKAPWNYWQVAVGMRGIRQAAACPLIYHLHLETSQKDPDSYSPATLKPLLATLLANGLGVSAITLPMSYQPDESSEANLAIRRYYRFAARYGEFLYDLNWHRASPDLVQIKTPPNKSQRPTENHHDPWASSDPGKAPGYTRTHQMGPHNPAERVGCRSRWRPATLPALPVPNRRWYSSFYHPTAGHMDDDRGKGSQTYRCNRAKMNAPGATSLT